MTAKREEGRRRLYAARRRKGLCGKCGAPPTRGAYCDRCRAQHAYGRNQRKPAPGVASMTRDEQQERRETERKRLGENLVGRVKVYTAEEREAFARARGIK